MKALDELKAADNTYFIYMSDNGAGGGKGNGSLRGGKGGVWEGGIRVPLIIRGPNSKPTPFAIREWWVMICIRLFASGPA